MEYNGKVMRMELVNGAEALGTFVSADQPSQQITFVNGTGNHNSRALVNHTQSVWIRCRGAILHMS